MVKDCRNNKKSNNDDVASE